MHNTSYVLDVCIHLESTLHITRDELSTCQSLVRHVILKYINASLFYCKVVARHHREEVGSLTLIGKTILIDVCDYLT